jgi:hypothetical protein
VLAVAPAGQCVVTTVEAGELTTSPRVPPNPMLMGFDAGASVALSGPRGKVATLQKRTGEAAYSSTLASAFAGSPTNFLEAGPWEMSAPGGSDILAFRATAILPDPVSLRAPLTASRRASLNVSWTGGGTTDQVLLVGTSQSGIRPSEGSTGAFACTPTPGTRTFLVPAAVLSQIPGGVGILTVVSSGSGPAPSLDVSGGGKIDFTAFTYAYSASVVIRFE